MPVPAVQRDALLQLPGAPAGGAVGAVRAAREAENAAAPELRVELHFRPPPDWAGRVPHLRRRRSASGWDRMPGEPLEPDPGSEGWWTAAFALALEDLAERCPRRVALELNDGALRSLPKTAASAAPDIWIDGAAAGGSAAVPYYHRHSGWGTAVPLRPSARAWVCVEGDSPLAAEEAIALARAEVREAAEGGGGPGVLVLPACVTAPCVAQQQQQADGATRRAAILRAGQELIAAAHQCGVSIAIEVPDAALAPGWDRGFAALAVCRDYPADALVWPGGSPSELATHVCDVWEVSGGAVASVAPPLRGPAPGAAPAGTCPPGAVWGCDWAARAAAHAVLMDPSGCGVDLRDLADDVCVRRLPPLCVAPLGGPMPCAALRRCDRPRNHGSVRLPEQLLGCCVAVLLYGCLPLLPLQVWRHSSVGATHRQADAAAADRQPAVVRVAERNFILAEREGALVAINTGDAERPVSCRLPWRAPLAGGDPLAAARLLSGGSVAVGPGGVVHFTVPGRGVEAVLRHAPCGGSSTPPLPAPAPNAALAAAAAAAGCIFGPASRGAVWQGRLVRAVLRPQLVQGRLCLPSGLPLPVLTLEPGEEVVLCIDCLPEEVAGALCTAAGAAVRAAAAEGAVILRAAAPGTAQLGGGVLKDPISVTVSSAARPPSPPMLVATSPTPVVTQDPAVVEEPPVPPQHMCERQTTLPQDELNGSGDVFGAPTNTDVFSGLAADGPVAPLSAATLSAEAQYARGLESPCAPESLSPAVPPGHLGSTRAPSRSPSRSGRQSVQFDQLCVQRSPSRVSVGSFRSSIASMEWLFDPGDSADATSSWRDDSSARDPEELDEERQELDRLVHNALAEAKREEQELYRAERARRKQQEQKAGPGAPDVAASGQEQWRASALARVLCMVRLQGQGDQAQQAGVLLSADDYVQYFRRTPAGGAAGAPPGCMSPTHAVPAADADTLGSDLRSGTAAERMAQLWATTMTLAELQAEFERVIKESGEDFDAYAVLRAAEDAEREALLLFEERREKLRRAIQPKLRALRDSKHQADWLRITEAIQARAIAAIEKQVGSDRSRRLSRARQLMQDELRMRGGRNPRARRGSVQRLTESQRRRSLQDKPQGRRQSGRRASQSERRLSATADTRKRRGSASSTASRSQYMDF